MIVQTALVIRHAPFEDVGYLGNTITEAGAMLRYKEIGEPITPAEVEAASALILMGGPMSANDAAPWVANECGAIDAALKAGRPILGICLGAQLVASALGARVYRNPVKEIGWFPIHWTPDAAHDRLFHDCREPETVFHWHGETFDLPRGARWLAWSENCRHQAFAYDATTYALQFHIEVTPEMIENWCVQDANAGDVRELDGKLDAHAHAGRQRQLARMVFSRWLELWNK
jgi:GMP synthase (glutamine-hydrolysing)